MKRLRFLFVLLSVVMLISCESKKKSIGAEGEKQIYYSTEGKKQKSPDEREFVDLGLPSGVKWSTMNLGADYSQDIVMVDKNNKITLKNPQIYGGSYHWGSLTRGGEYVNVTHDISGDAKYDAARSEWGGEWRMPTENELKELKKHCTWEYVKDYGSDKVHGYIVTGINGNSIFMPIGGSRVSAVGTMSNTRSYANYCASTPVRAKSGGELKDCVHGLYLDEDTCKVVLYERSEMKFSIRPVKD